MTTEKTVEKLQKCIDSLLESILTIENGIKTLWEHHHMLADEQNEKIKQLTRRMDESDLDLDEGGTIDIINARLDSLEGKKGDNDNG